jgi:hypothetical protein
VSKADMGLVKKGDYYDGLLTQFGDCGANLLILLEIKMAIDS